MSDTPQAPTPVWNDAVKVSELAVGSHHNIFIQEQNIVLFHLEDGFFAVIDRCTHYGLPLSDGHIYNKHVIECPFHGAQFCIKTGKVLCMPAFDNLQTFETRIENDMVQILA